MDVNVVVVMRIDADVFAVIVTVVVVDDDDVVIGIDNVVIL